MTMIVDTKCEDGQEASVVKGGGGEGGKGGGGGGGKGKGGGPASLVHPHLSTQAPPGLFAPFAKASLGTALGRLWCVKPLIF